MQFQLHIILSALENEQNLVKILFFIPRITYVANNLGFSSILIFWGWGNLVPPNMSVNN